MGTRLRAAVVVQRSQAGQLRVDVSEGLAQTGLTGQIFSCFLDYDNGTSAGEGADVHSPCTWDVP